MLSEHDVLALLQYGEKIDLECKEAKNDVPKSIWETYSSFANTKGGTILLGIKEISDAKLHEENRYEIQGIKNIEKVQTDFWNVIHGDKVSGNILTDSNVYPLVIKSVDILVIEVPQADYTMRPIYINGNPLRGTYKRNNSGDYHATEEEVKSMLRDANDAGNDGTLLEGYGMDDIDLSTLKAYRLEFEIHNPDHVFNGLDNKEFLTNMGGYTKNRLTGKEGLTTAGLLMFGKGLSIRERFANIRMDYLDETNLIGDSRWSDRLTYDGSWENNLYNFIKRVMPKLVSELKRPFKLEGMNRVDDTPTHKAIREAVVNLVIHSDYLITGILKIIKKDTVFIFSNPGNLKLPLSVIYNGGTSKARNPRIQDMLRMLGLGDNIGSGFPTILSAWKQENWRKPDLSENSDLHVVELKLWTVSLMPEECTTALHELYGSDYDDLSSEEQIILSTAYLEKEVSNVRLQTILNIHSSDIGRLLNGLVQKEMIVSDNRGRWTTYTLNNHYEPHAKQLSLEESKEEVVLRKTNQLIYDFVKANRIITVQQVLDITRITSKTGAAAALKKLVDKGLIVKKRNGRSFYYELI